MSPQGQVGKPRACARICLECGSVGELTRQTKPLVRRLEALRPRFNSATSFLFGAALLLFPVGIADAHVNYLQHSAIMVFLWFAPKETLRSGAYGLLCSVNDISRSNRLA